MEKKALEIVCSACGAETLARREAVYEGFKRLGEKFVCIACRHEYACEADLPLKRRAAPAVFGTDDAPKRIDIFRDEEAPRTCRRCGHYVVNPFTQRCGLRLREVKATDSCDDFVEPLPEDAPQDSES